jgi:hypothetical protein
MSATELVITLAAMVFAWLAFRGLAIAWLEYRDRKRWEALQTQRPYIRRN